MTILESFFELAAEYVASKRPATVDVVDAHGNKTTMVLKTSAGGAAEYTPRGSVQREERRADVVQESSIYSVEHFSNLVSDTGVSVFVNSFKKARSIDESAPETGGYSLVVQPHRDWERLLALTQPGPKQFTHRSFVEFLEDISSTMEEPVLVDALRHMRAVAKSEWDGKQDDGESSTVSNTWENATVTKAVIPREIHVNVLPTVEPGAKPVRATLRVRVERAKDGIAPVFAVSWFDVAECHWEAQKQLCAMIPGAVLGLDNVKSYIS